MSKLREQRIEMLKEMAKKTGGMITTSQIEKAGISRVLIPTFIDEGVLVKEARGIYYYADEFPDDLQIIQANNPRVVYSYGTALYLWDMSDRTPHVWDVSVPQGFNATRLKKDNKNIRLHYINADKWSVGITETLTPDGNNVRLYDKERCIIDLIKKKDKIDKQLYLQALHEYFNDRTNDHVQLIRYAKIFHIERPVRDYMDILTG
ncbi:MAG: type IV toxin-antitoxin system AbiEi family antitoxin domain-containing protein [Lachnospiraceae bacterium]|nr:type IV toxin-antitoxin system AbiEi family antitoxin domain-containing protein [Lachnospiraceae bacterium]